MKLNKVLLAVASVALMLSMPLAAADHNTGHNVSTSVDGQLNSWIPTILALVFLGIGLGALFTALHKMKGSAK